MNIKQSPNRRAQAEHLCVQQQQEIDALKSRAAKKVGALQWHRPQRRSTGGNKKTHHNIYQIWCRRKSQGEDKVGAAKSTSRHSFKQQAGKDVADFDKPGPALREAPSRPPPSGA
eukprot:scaffold207384_cov23-Tisochrysis_lutea.AAC.2